MELNNQDFNRQNMPDFAAPFAIMGTAGAMPKLPSELSSTSLPAAAPVMQMSLEYPNNVDTPLFTRDAFSQLNNCNPLFYNGEPSMQGQNTTHGNSKVNEEIKSMLWDISGRLKILEAAVSRGNSKIDELELYVSGLLNDPLSAAVFQRAMNDLGKDVRRDIKYMMRDVLSPILGIYVTGNMDQGEAE
ncbi:hypothetical protein PT974_02883 [Cladobotryum mycophilum]|uniref:Uncharacterized protein n=1 Tax=Cladobotryum mycophilum TaxID=491253 RepID=A0ABR0T0I3_9HYPO